MSDCPCDELETRFSFTHGWVETSCPQCGRTTANRATEDDYS